MRLAEAGRGAVAVAAVPLAAAGIGRGWQVLAQLRSPAWGLSHFHFLWLSGPGRQALGVLWAAGRPRGPAVIAVLEQLNFPVAALLLPGTVAAVSVGTVPFRLTWLTCLLLDQPSQRILEAHLSNFLVALLQGALAADCASLNLTSY